MSKIKKNKKWLWGLNGLQSRKAPWAPRAFQARNGFNGFQAFWGRLCPPHHVSHRLHFTMAAMGAGGWWRSRTTALLLFSAMAVGLTACGGKGGSAALSICPAVDVLGIAQSVYRFAPSADSAIANDPAQLKYQASLTYGDGECSLDGKGDRHISVSLPPKLKVIFGPKWSSDDSVTVIATLLNKKSKVVAKKTRKILLVDKNEPGFGRDDVVAGREKYFSWNESLETLLDGETPASGYRLILAIKLTDAEIENIKSSDPQRPLPNGLGLERG